MPLDPDEAKRRLEKFLERAEVALASPLFSAGQALFQMQIQFQVDPTSGQPAFAGLRLPSIDLTELKAAILDCRVFFLSGEDCYLPSVVRVLQGASDDEHARNLRRLKAFVRQFVDGGLVGGNFVYSGRLESDNGAATPGALLGSGQIAMDYIYGVAVHQDEDRIRRLENVGDVDTMKHATAMELAHLIRAVATVREQIRFSSSGGHLRFTVSVGPASPWAATTPPPNVEAPIVVDVEPA